jgi:hypothetical protein
VTAPANASEVSRRLSALTEKLYQHVRSYSDAERDAVALRHAADVIESKAFLRAEGSVESRKHQARIDADDAEEKALVAEAVVRSLRAKIRAIETDIDVHRTYGATVRAELKTLSYGEAP